MRSFKIYLLVLACTLAQPMLAHAVGLNAYHFFVRDGLYGIGDATPVGANTRYTPDLDLRDPVVFENRLLNSLLDELYLKITFKPGITPHISKLVDIRYGNEFTLTPTTQRFYSRVIGQDLLVWYGLEDRADFGFTQVLTDSEWTFTIVGNEPVASVDFLVSHHSKSATDMPDLQAFNNLHLVAPEDVPSLFRETSATPVSGKPLTSAQKLIVLVHGRNTNRPDDPSWQVNNFAPSVPGSPLSPCWAELASNLVENAVVEQFGWTVARYDWSRDAATGDNRIDRLVTHANASRDAASAHGAKLGQLIRNAGATHVQFIAHSAGNWAARRAAAYLKYKNPAIQIQITSLDPFVNDDDPTGFDLKPAFELTPLWTDHRDNIYVVDGLQSDSLSDAAVGWTSGDFSGWNNADIEYLSLYESWMKDHAGPISWYGRTIPLQNLGNRSLMDSGDGFISSLPVRLASPNDNFPGETLTGTSGNATWYNYQATAQTFEPAHASLEPARRSVWGRWTAPASGTVTFDTFGANFYNILAVYSGNSVNALTQIARDTAGGKGPGQCEITFNAVAGQTYSIVVDGIIGDAGQSPLHWRMDGSGSTPTVSLTTPASGVTVSGLTNVVAFATGASKVEFYLDGIRQITDTAAPFLWSWNTISVANGPHILAAKSYSGATLLATSPNVTVTVNNSGTPPPCADAAEPNDSSLTATTLAVGGSASGYVCSATDVDWFKVTVTGTGPLTFNLTVPAQNDYDLELYGPDFTFVKGSYRDVGQSESATVTVNQPGTYYARVYGYPVGSGSFNATTSYTLNGSLNGTNLIGVGRTAVSWGVKSSPIVEPGTRFTAIAANAPNFVSLGFNLALKTDGSVLAWGRNPNGQCDVPIGLQDVVSIAAGRQHSLALKRDGTVVSWGANGLAAATVPVGLTDVVAIAAANSFSLAIKRDGTVTGWWVYSTDEYLVPEGVTNISSIAIGYFHTLALRRDGTVIAWGSDSYGETIVPEGLGDVTAVAAGRSFSLALKRNGTVVGWGDNSSGQISIPDGLDNVIAISAGASHCLALKRDGTVVAWGTTNWGQAIVPEGLGGVVGIAAGANHSLALKNDGTFVAWGRNSWGESSTPDDYVGVTAISARGSYSLALKGDGSVQELSSPFYPSEFYAPLPALNDAIAISAGGSHCLALKQDGTVAAWGNTNYGLSAVPEALNNVGGIAAGYGHSLALKTDGTVVAWGDTSLGQTIVPEGLNNVKSIAAGGGFSLALKTEGTVVGWGMGWQGMSQEINIPTDLAGVTSIAAGANHALALKDNGTVVAWGWNDVGQTAVPERLANVIAIAAGDYHSIALKIDGTVVTWGNTNFGMSTFPVDRKITAIAAGGSYSLALVSDEVVIAIPTVQTQPQSRSIAIGDTVSFTVAVTGTPPFTYQWFRNSATLAGATSATLTLANAQPAQAGSYTVRITGPGGSVMSNPATLSFLEDSNNNGLPDTWELAHGFALDNPNTASADPDLDGTTNAQEYLAGTDPRSAASVFRVSITSSGVSGFQIAFTTVPGRTYRIERASSPSGPWTLLEGNLPGTGSLLQVTDSPASSTSRFYRIRTP